MVRRNRYSWCYLPQELWNNILSRLPVKSLLRFRCVCKSWCSEMDARSFAYMHVSNYENNREGNHLLITNHPYFRDLRTRWYTLCSNTFKRSRLQQIEIFRHYFVLGDVNGIVIAKLSPGFNLKELCASLCLVNPSIRKYVEVPSIYAPGEPSWWPTIGLGFDSHDDDYKVLAMAFSSTHYVAAKVYSLRYGCWKSIAPPTRPSSVCRDQPLFLRGRLHWMGGEFILSFDVHDEKFGYIKLPESAFVGNVIKLIRFPGDSLGILVSFMDHISIWVMKEYGVADSWMMTSTLKGLQHLDGDFLHQKRNGELLFGMVSRQKKRYKRQKGEDMIEMEYDRSRDGVRLFDVSKASCVKHLAEGCAPKNVCVVDYVESLALYSEGESY